ncbi:MAG: ABC transporter ATP-binding protein [Thermoleophilaceae bacterium]|nr:ABC transporter ATP-binding protein [Thermoleophilaceae bacterium]
MGEPVIKVRGLRKSYGSVEAVRDIDLEVAAGEVFAFLGPNGAGKTTTVEILEGYRQRDAGEVSVLGVDPAHPTREWRERIGLVLQDMRVEPLLTVREVLELYAGYYRRPRSVEETIALVGLTDKADERVGRLSGGQQRRVDVALALIGDPDLVFLDEPTTGFDPSARRGAWEVISGLRALGKSIFLTTHYMDEAQHLADRVAIIVGGRIVAEGPPSELGGERGRLAQIRFRAQDGLRAADLPSGLGRGPVEGDGWVRIASDAVVADLHALTGWALERGVDLPGLEVERPRLEDVYLDLTAEPEREAVEA